MVNVDLTPTELAMVISRVDRYPGVISSMERNLVTKLREAVPAPTVNVALTAEQIDQIKDWWITAWNEGKASADDPRTEEIFALLDQAREKLDALDSDQESV